MNKSGAKQFIPAFMSFGDSKVHQIGTQYNNEVIHTKSQALADIENVDVTDFSTTSLSKELVGKFNEDLKTIFRCAIQRTSFGEATSDAITLKLSTLFSTGFYSKNCYRNEYRISHNAPIYFTELGLWANDYVPSISEKQGTLLARVIFDKEDEVIEQRDNEVIYVDWEIEIASVDNNFSESNTTNIIWNIDNN